MLMPFVANPPMALYRAAGMLRTRKTKLVIMTPSPRLLGSISRDMIKKRVVFVSSSSISRTSTVSSYCSAASSDAKAPMPCSGLRARSAAAPALSTAVSSAMPFCMRKVRHWGIKTGCARTSLISLSVAPLGAISAMRTRTNASSMMCRPDAGRSRCMSATRP